METQIRIRLSLEDKQAILELSRLRGKTMSKLIREYISSQTKAA